MTAKSGAVVLAFVVGCVDVGDVGDISDDVSLGSSRQGLTGLQTVKASTPYDGRSLKVLQLQCPSGTVALTPTYVADAAGAILTDVVVDTELIDERTVRTRASDPAASPSWRFATDVTCVDAPKTAQLVTAISAGIGNLQELELACPDGMVALTAGLAADDTGRGALPARILSSSPKDDGRVWRATARGILTDEWALRGAALCVDRSELVGYDLVTATSGLAIAPWQRMRAHCSAGIATGGGATALDTYDTPVDATTFYATRWPAAFEVGMRVDPSWTDPWKVQVTSICVE